MKHWNVPAACLLLFLGVSALGSAQASPQEPADQKPAPDNTAINKRDRSTGALTADKQQGRPDTETTRMVRRSIVKDKSLSTYAHNVKVVTQAGVVTLRGPVNSADEKHAIELKATEVAGAGNVKNELEVQPTKKGSE